MRRQHYKSGNVGIYWPVFDQVNSLYSGRLKYIYHDFTTNSDYVIIDMPNSTSYSDKKHTFLVVSQTEILATFNYTFRVAPQAPGCSSIDGYFFVVTGTKPWTIWLFRYYNGSISFVLSNKSGYNWFAADCYAYEFNGNKFISCGKINTCQTPTIYNISTNVVIASETTGRTSVAKMSHTYETSYPFLSFIYFEKHCQIVKSANAYGYGFNSESDSTGLTNCVAVSNKLIGSADWKFVQRPIFGTDPNDLNNWKRFIHNGAWHPFIHTSDFSRISVDTGTTMPFVWTDGWLPISEYEYYECTPSQNYDILLKVFPVVSAVL